MNPDTTWLPAARADFSATAWSCILLRRDATPQERQAHLEELARRYWKPIYAYIKARWHKSNDDAKDLTQQFFLWMLDTEFLSKVREGRGRFRNFVKTAVERFVMGEHDAQRALKRGGDRAHVSLDFIQHVGVEPPAGTTPEQVLDDQWRRAAIDEALGRLRAYYAAEGKEIQYRIFEDFYFAPEPGPDYPELAARHGVSATDVANWLARARSRFRAQLEHALLAGVGGSDELAAEFAELFDEDERR
jgi:RNA polymerase sigma-70 factor (ECF subfamily)